MKSLVAELRPDGDRWLDKNGVSWESKLDYLTCEVLGFCGCGDPEGTAEYVRDAVRLVKMLREGPMDQWSQWYKDVYQPAVDALFKGSSGAEYFMWYYLDSKGFTEHGGAVPGWLTGKGEALFTDLEALCVPQEA